jgi:hypothetical protein
MKKVEIVVDRNIVIGTAAGVVKEESGALRPDRGTTAKVAVKEKDKDK